MGRTSVIYIEISSNLVRNVPQDSVHDSLPYLPSIEWIVLRSLKVAPRVKESGCEAGILPGSDVIDVFPANEMQKHGAKAIVGDKIHDRIHTTVKINDDCRPIVDVIAVFDNLVFNQERNNPDGKPTSEEQQSNYSASGRYAKGAPLTSSSLLLL